MSIFSYLVNKTSEIKMPELLNAFNFTDDEIKYGMSALIVVITGFCILWAYKRRKGVYAKHKLRRSMSIGTLRGGKIALQRLLDFYDARADNLKFRLEEELNKEYLNMKTLQSIVSWLEIIGYGNDTIKKLEVAKQKADEKGNHYEAYEMEMLTAELLIYQGKYEKAKLCKCLNDDEVSDARRPLFKAIISLLEGGKDSDTAAQTLWDEHTEIRRDFTTADGYHNLSFDEFHKIVESIRNETPLAKKTKPTSKTKRLNM